MMQTLPDFKMQHLGLDVSSMRFLEDSRERSCDKVAKLPQGGLLLRRVRFAYLPGRTGLGARGPYVPDMMVWVISQFLISLTQANMRTAVLHGISNVWVHLSWLCHGLVLRKTRPRRLLSEFLFQSCSAGNYSTFCMDQSCSCKKDVTKRNRAAC